MRNRQFLFILMFILLLFSTIYSYSLSEWRIEDNTCSLIGVTNIWTTLPKYLALLIGIYLCFIDSNQSWIISSHKGILVFCAFLAIFWFIESVISGGFIDALYAANTPLVLISLTFIILGTKEEYWDYLLKIAPLFAVLYVVLMLSNHFAFNQLFNANLAGNNPITTYLVSSFWWSSVMAIRFRESSFKYKLIFLFLLCSIAYIAFIYTFRSWIIQSILLLIFTLFVSSKGTKTSRIIVPIAIVLAMCIIIPSFLHSATGSEAVDNIISKSESDTRSFQYEELFSQLGVFDLMFGKGLYATYYSQTNGGGSYSYIDNQYLMVLFHFGFLMFITYFGLWFKTSFKWLTHLKSIPIIDCMPLIVLCLWMCAWGGLSVYNALVFCPQMFIMPIILGKSMTILKSYNLKV